MHLDLNSRWDTLPYIVDDRDPYNEPWKTLFRRLQEITHNATNPPVCKARLTLWGDSRLEYLTERTTTAPTPEEQQPICVDMTSSCNGTQGVTVEMLMKSLLWGFEIVQHRFRRLDGTHLDEFVRDFKGFRTQYIDTEGRLHLRDSQWEIHDEDFREW